MNKRSVAIVRFLALAMLALALFACGDDDDAGVASDADEAAQETQESSETEAAEETEEAKATQQPTEEAGLVGPGEGQIVFQAVPAPGLAVMNADGTDVKVISADPAGIYYPDVSPDGTRIAYTRGGCPQNGVPCRHDGSNNFGIYVMNADGTGVSQLTAEYDLGQNWSPDGTRIAFTRGRGDVLNPDNFGIWVMNADGSAQTQLTSGPTDAYGPNWSPDGTRLVFGGAQVGDLGIFVMNFDGTGLTHLADAGLGIGPKWSPDGTKIAFAVGDFGSEGIYVMNSDGTGVARLTNEFDQGPTWSPDGTQIAFSRGLNVDDVEAIYVMNADGTGVTKLTATGIASDWVPALAAP